MITFWLVLSVYMFIGICCGISSWIEMSTYPYRDRSGSVVVRAGKSILTGVFWFVVVVAIFAYERYRHWKKKHK